MLNDWTDRMSPGEADALRRRLFEDKTRRRIDEVERELAGSIAASDALPIGFYEAMGHFLRLRDRLFPGLPADPAWKILVTLARTEPDSPKSSVTGIAHGAEVPLTTALRYIAAMELEGILERAPHPLDKRQTMIRLTEAGQRRLDAIAEGWTMRLLLIAAVPLAMLFYARSAYAG